MNTTTHRLAGFVVVAGPGGQEMICQNHTRLVRILPGAQLRGGT
jgi:hypothetical protein